MTDQAEGARLFGGAEPGKELAVLASSSAPAPSQVSSAGGIHVVRFTMRPTGDGTFQIHYKQNNQLPN